jgi:hypothetical protein
VTTVSNKQVAALFLKYLTLQPASVLVGEEGENELKLWFCPESGAPSMGSGVISDVPIDTPMSCVFINGPKLLQATKNEKEGHSNLLDSVLQSVAGQLQRQLDDFALEPNSKQALFASKIIESDDDVKEIQSLYLGSTTVKH